MSYLKLAWVPRTTPAQDINNAVHQRIDWRINNLIRESERLLALQEVHTYFDEQERDKDTPTKYAGEDYVSYSVETGDRASELLKWWSKRGYDIRRFSDDASSSSRDYVMYKRQDESVTFNLYMYFKGDEDACRFEDAVDAVTGEKIIDYMTQAVPAKEAVPPAPVYKRELICGGSAVPDAVEDEG